MNAVKYTPTPNVRMFLVFSNTGSNQIKEGREAIELHTPIVILSYNVFKHAHSKKKSPSLVSFERRVFMD